MNDREMELAAKLFGKKRLEDSINTSGSIASEYQVMQAVAKTDSTNGKVIVELTHGTTSPAQEMDGYQLNGPSVEIATSTDIRKGDTVIIGLYGNSSAKTMIASEVISGGDRTKNDIKTVHKTAQKAAADIDNVQASIEAFKSDAATMYSTKKERVDGDNEVKTFIETNYTNSNDLNTTYATKSEVRQTDTEIRNEVTTNYATKSYVNSTNQAIAEANNATFATKTEVNTAAAAQNTYTDNKVHTLKTDSDTKYATKTALESTNSDLAVTNTKVNTAQQTANAAKTKAETAASVADNAKAAADTTSENLTSFIQTTNHSVADLQSQIDGSIQDWFYEGAPTNFNEPAKNWTTDDLKNKHLGDLYYDLITGKSYRWQVTNNQYSWAMVVDGDVEKALTNAAKAQDTADAKRRVFYTTPTVPYDKGDLWAQGTSGDILRCNVAKTSEQSYAISDWVKASKYTDDTATTDLSHTLQTNYRTSAAQDIKDNAITQSVSDNLQTAKTYANGLVETEVTNRNSAITTKADEIISTVNTTIENTNHNISVNENNISNLRQLFTSLATTVTQNADGLRITSELAQTIRDTLSNVSATVTQLKSFINFGMDPNGNAQMLMGSSASSVLMELTNETLNFKSKDTNTVLISLNGRHQTAEIPNIALGKYMIVGNDTTLRIFYNE